MKTNKSTIIYIIIIMIIGVFYWPTPYNYFDKVFRVNRITGQIQVWQSGDWIPLRQ